MTGACGSAGEGGAVRGHLWRRQRRPVPDRHQLHGAASLPAVLHADCRQLQLCCWQCCPACVACKHPGRPISTPLSSFSPDNAAHRSWRARGRACRAGSPRWGATSWTARRASARWSTSPPSASRPRPPTQTRAPSGCPCSGPATPPWCELLAPCMQPLQVPGLQLCMS